MIANGVCKTPWYRLWDILLHDCTRRMEEFSISGQAMKKKMKIYGNVRMYFIACSEPYDFLSKMHKGDKLNSLFVAFVEDNATLSSIRYFENHIDCCSFCKSEGSKPY